MRPHGREPIPRRDDADPCVACNLLLDSFRYERHPPRRNMGYGGKRNRLIIVSNRLPVRVQKSGAGGWDSSFRRRARDGARAGFAPAWRDVDRLARARFAEMARSRGDSTRRHSVSARSYRTRGRRRSSGSTAASPTRSSGHCFTIAFICAISIRRSGAPTSPPISSSPAGRPSSPSPATSSGYTITSSWAWAQRCAGSASTTRSASSTISLFRRPISSVGLPWREAILDSLLEYDLIGFQLERDEAHFHDCLGALKRSPRLHLRAAAARLPAAGSARRPLSYQYRLRRVRRRSEQRGSTRARDAAKKGQCGPEVAARYRSPRLQQGSAREARRFPPRAREVPGLARSPHADPARRAESRRAFRIIGRCGFVSSVPSAN